MLKNTFLHVPGVGHKTEQRFWAENILSWESFLSRSRVPGLSKNTVSRIDKWLIASEEALDREDIRFFGENLEKREWWRIYPEFRESVAFLDIETTGLSFYYDDITLIGVFNGEKVKTFIQGQNLKDFGNEIRKYSLLVTYNGTLFDVPFIYSKVGNVDLPPVHVDLRFLLRRLGYKGGLKSIEEQVGISRGEEVSEMDGFGATVLWNRYERGHDDALELLVKYNITDIVHLKTLLEMAYRTLHEALLSNARTPHFGYHPSNFDVHVERERNLKLRLVVGDNNTVLIDPQNNRLNREKIDTLLPRLKWRARARKGYPRAVGIDLSGSEKRKTGWALLEGRKVETKVLKTDEEIVNVSTSSDPDLISIDSPLSLPKGRDCTEDSCDCRKFGITREAERILRKRGVYVFPSLIRSMQPLTERGIRLREEFEKMGYSVIESYPGAAQDVLRIIRKKISLKDLKQGLVDYGVRGKFVERVVTHDELDAITSALVGYFYLGGVYEALGNEEEGYLIIPKVDKK